MEMFVSKVKGPLANEVAIWKQFDPKEYKNYLAQTHTPLEMVFVGVENRQPKWVIRRFYVHEENGHVTVDAKEEKRKKRSGIYGIGYWGPAGEYLHKRPISSLSELKTEVTAALQHSADSDPNKGVGGPFSILLLEKSGRSWIQQGECPLD
jgi:hypothetical protein